MEYEERVCDEFGLSVSLSWKVMQADVAMASVGQDDTPKEQSTPERKKRKNKKRVPEMRMYYRCKSRGPTLVAGRSSCGSCSCWQQ